MNPFRLQPPPPLKISENDVRDACLQVLKLRGWWPVRQHVGRFQSASKSWVNIGVPGDPDYAIMQTRMQCPHCRQQISAPGFFLETKRPGGILSEIQQIRIKQLKTLSGMDTVVVADVADLVAFLDGREVPARWLDGRDDHRDKAPPK